MGRASPLRLTLSAALAGVSLAAILPQAALSSNSGLAGQTSDDNPLPLVIWHGLGDDYASEGMKELASLAEDIHPGTFVYTVALGKDASADRSASWLGNVTNQVQTVCDALAAHPILSTAPAIDAIGFSQGGQFLRAYVERCNRPPVRSLVTYGSQHNGIAEFRACGSSDWLCKGAMLLLHHNTWSNFVQSRLVPAQYFRDPADYQSYLDNSNFLADINNEREPKNVDYRRNLASLTNLVLYMFERDTVVIPRHTSWFAEVNGTDVVPLRKRKMYRDDWLGLRELDDRGSLWFRSLSGDHMDITIDDLNTTIKDFFGPLDRKFGKPTFAPDEL
ncbi:hypothetical protein HIM_03394 [Hirsutella minnesotensis 3608]|uniref:Palmitoyl-protein thioesterase 1 n=1 Tax=Hirsutella minnesotensis 3608 TaxID=1043627 RepID=A0A0F7ZVR5_9HYPO|nr:hypothetical protein HIM_03394 [Hirsutella minnesotensis 3608]